MSNVLINGRTAVHAGSGGSVNSPDVCKTPDKCPPVTYNNVARSSDAAGTAATVFVNGHPVCHKDAFFSRSTGDEAGSCGGIRSGSIAGRAEFLTASPDVFIEGIPAVRQGDLMVSNNRNTPPAPLMQPGASRPSAEAFEGPARELEADAAPERVDWSTAGEAALVEAGHGGEKKNA